MLHLIHNQIHNVPKPLLLHPEVVFIDESAALGFADEEVRTHHFPGLLIRCRERNTLPLSSVRQIYTTSN